MNPIPALFAFFDVGGPEVVMIMLIILVLFGGDKLPELARGLGKSVREFKKATAGVEEEIKKAIQIPDSPPQPKPAAKPATEQPQKPPTPPVGS